MSIRIKNWKHPVDREAMMRNEIEIVPLTEEEIRKLKIGDRVLVEAFYYGEKIYVDPTRNVEIVAIVEPEEEPKADIDMIVERVEKQMEELRKMIDELKGKVKL